MVLVPSILVFGILPLKELGVNVGLPKILIEFVDISDRPLI